MPSGSDRRKCPAHFDTMSMEQCLLEAEEELKPCIDRCKAGGQLIVWNHSLAAPDRSGMSAHPKLLDAMLQRNPTGIFKKTTIMKGLENWQSSKGNFMKNGKSKFYINDTAHDLMLMHMHVRDTARNVITGSRVPSWLFKLTQLLDSQTLSLAPSPQCQPEQGPPSKSDPRFGKLLFLGESADKPRTRPLLRRRTTNASDSVASQPEHTDALQMESEIEPESPPIKIEARRPQKKQEQHHVKAEIKAETKAETKVKAEPPDSQFDEDHGIFFVGEGDGCGHRIKDGQDDVHDASSAHASGFVQFEWHDGDKWVSEIPHLGWTDPNSPILKRPAAEPVVKKPAAMPVRKKPAADSSGFKCSARKREYSNIYKRTMTEYRNECSRRGIKFDKNKASKQARLAARASGT